MSLEQFKDDISLKEKYTSFNKEKRIRRMQFFERMLIPALLLWVILWIPAMIAWALFSPENILKMTFYISLLIYSIYIFIIIKIFPVTIKKRAHDFWKEWKFETYAYIIPLILSILYQLYVLYLTSNLDYQWLMNLSQYNQAMTWIQSIISLTWIWLLFRPGTKWKNEYWEQKYYKVKFLW